MMFNVTYIVSSGDELVGEIDVPDLEAPPRPDAGDADEKWEAYAAAMAPIANAAFKRVIDALTDLPWTQAPRHNKPPLLIRSASVQAVSISDHIPRAQTW